MNIGKWLYDTGICDSASEANRLIKQGGMSINKEKIPPNIKYIYFGRGKYVLSPYDVEATDEYKEFINKKL